MNIKVNIHDKKRFVMKLLACHTFKAFQSESILKHLLKDEQLLQLTHFVKDIMNCPRAIIMTTIDTVGEPILFYKGNIKTANGWQAYHDLRLNNREPVFIQINMVEQYDKLFYAVLETNPYLNKNQYVNDKQTMTHDLKTMKQRQQKQYLEQKIDQALDENDKQTFLHLSLLLKKLQED